MEGITLSKKLPHPDFQTIFRMHYPKVVRQISGFTGSTATAEDLAQEVFLRLYNVDWAQIQNLNAWLTKCSFHAACNYVRGEKRRVAREALDYQMNYPNLKSDEETQLEALLIREETRHAVFETLSELEERDRLLLLLKYEDYSYREIAETLALNPASVGTLLARARKQFQNLYQKGREDA
ncbi:MAG: sigma-70 family RNA polymerase sigma factor [Dehalobacter sp.]|nr:sigma-70 family RNA polymerase sigma factor [Dehalobacter sp.]